VNYAHQENSDVPKKERIDMNPNHEQIVYGITKTNSGNQPEPEK